MDLIMYSSLEGYGAALSVPYDLDLSINGTNDFQVQMYYQYLGDFGQGTIVDVPGTEYGGIVKDVSGATNTEKVNLHGYTWRGLLSKHIIEPDPGEDYLITERRDINETIGDLLVRSGIWGFFRNPTTPAGVIGPYQFDRYIDLAAGLEKMAEANGFRLNFRLVPPDAEYIFGAEVEESFTAGWIEVSAVPVKNYGSEIEVSQDSKIDFYSQDYRMGVNHLICLGTGQLAQRTVVHLYADADGNISKTQTFFGTDEIAEVFENPSADAETLEETGTARFQQLLNFKKFTADAKYIDDINLSIGDTITGKDLITGTVVTKPIRQKIVKITNGIPSVEYTI